MDSPLRRRRQPHHGPAERLFRSRRRRGTTETLRIVQHMTCRDDYFVATAETQRKRAKQYETRNSRHWTRGPTSRSRMEKSWTRHHARLPRPRLETCPVPRIPSFILFCSLSLCFCCSDEVIVAAGH